MDADECNLVFGVDASPRHSSGSVPQLTWKDDQGQRRWAGLEAGFSPQDFPWQQEELRLLCAEMATPGHPVVHSLWDNTGGCLFAQLFNYVNASNGRFSWPIAPPTAFMEALLELLNVHPHLRGSVGFRADANTGYPMTRGALPTEVAWIKEQLRSKYPGNGAMMNDPERLDQYEDEWGQWWGGLEASIAAMPSWLSTASRPAAGSSVFRSGWLTCTQFALAPTLRAFLEGVTRALVYTPLFSLTAMLLFLGDAYLCYAALYTIVAIIVLVLGLLGFLGLSLGPIESLSFAIVIGVSVDYLVHFAYAFKHSLLLEQYYKSRAVLMARSGSTVASGLTTLCAVIPLLWASILPLQIFGVIFTVVALVSLGCAMLLFNSLLMVTGPGIKMSVHSLPSGSALAPVVSRSSASSVDDAEKAAAGTGSALLVSFPSRAVADTDRSAATSTSTTSATDRPAVAVCGGFRGHSAKGVPGAIKV